MGSQEQDTLASVRAVYRTLVQLEARTINELLSDWYLKPTSEEDIRVRRAWERLKQLGTDLANLLATTMRDYVELIEVPDELEASRLRDTLITYIQARKTFVPGYRDPDDLPF